MTLMERSLNNVSDRILKRLPNFPQDLKDAGSETNPISYLSGGLAAATVAFIFLFVVLNIAFSVGGIKSPVLVLSISIFAGVFLMFITLARPGITIRRYASNLERNLVFGLEALEIELSSGKTLGKAISSISKGDYGRLSVEFRKIIEDDEKGVSLGEAFRESARRTPSVFYRRVVCEITNALETGADIRDNISSIITELMKEQEFVAREYGSKLTPMVTLYMLLGILIPALMGTFLLIASTFRGMGFVVEENTYWMLVGISVVLQAFFLYTISFRKPPLLGELKMAERMTPKGLVNRLTSLLSYAGIDEKPEQFLLKRFAMSVAFALILGVVAETYIHLNFTFASIILFILFWSLLYSHLNMKADARGDEVAGILPEALRMVAANIKAGMTIDQALLTAGRPEFGTLSREIKRMGGEVMLGKSLKDALLEIKRRIKSTSLDMSVTLVGHGIEAGEGLSDSLIRIADMLRKREFVMREIRANLGTNKFMIMFIIMLGAPVLYSLSSSKSPGASITKDFLDKFSIVSLLVTSVMGSMMIGLVETGKIREGARYILLVGVTATLVYFIVNILLQTFSGGVFT
ncbi:MAG: type II secretion system F family protein [Candidatus Altiarchaeota archaeon]|nr:type II secretion system F family protein [Candidatus Altiarchaeota archaeon]